jgi:hypothetical protein
VKLPQVATAIITTKSPYIARELLHGVDFGRRCNRSARRRDFLFNCYLSGRLNR